MEQELIKHAAVKSDTGWIFLGKCHADCLHQMHNLKVKYAKQADAQGFVTNHGRYLNRHEAAALAMGNDQIDKATTLLFSEDLWCPEYEGKHDYCNIKGYTLKK